MGSMARPPRAAFFNGVKLGLRGHDQAALREMARAAPS